MSGTTDLTATAVPRPGLSAAAAAARLAHDGPNLLPVRRPPPAWRQLGEQMVHFFALMLWVAGAWPSWPACRSWAWRSSWWW